MSERSAALDCIVLPEHFFGRTEIQSRIRRDGLRFIGEGRSLHYDRDGMLVKDSGWTPTGVEMEAPNEAVARQVEALCVRP